MSSKQAAIRRLLADLRRSETRGSAMHRVRRRATAELKGRTGRSGSAGSSAGTGGDSTARTSTGPKRSDSWYVGEWSRLAKAVFGPEAAGDETAVDSARAPAAIKRAGGLRAQAVLAEAIARGERLERAATQSVAALTGAEEWHAAWSVAEGFSRLPGGAVASAMGHAVLHHRRRQFDRVWNVVRDLDDEVLATYIPLEAVDAALAAGTAEARQKALAIAVPAEGMDAAVLVDLAGRFLVVGERERAAELVAELRRRPSIELDDRRRYSWMLIERWLEHRPRSVPTGSIPMAILDYQSPDHQGGTSGNLGDYIQTLSLLGNLVRMTDVTFSGDDGLGAVASELKGRVQPQLRAAGVTGSVHLVSVNRDFSSADDVPEGTWMLAFGWHMHALYDLRYDFPYHPNIRPLFISFHVNRLEMLTDEAQAYLRRHGPIGCRDWTTVFLLLSAGIDAFFSGCVTTTVDALFPPRETAYRGKGAVGVIDLPRTAAGRDARNVRVYGHQSDEYRYMSASEGLRAADATLGGYQRDLDRAITGRLLAYLPLTALGVPVEFRTARPGDVRFAGLTDLRPGDPRLTQLRSGIRDLVARTFEQILAGATEDEVYGSWRERTRERVAEARARFEAPLAETPRIDVAGAVATSRAGSRAFGPHDAVDRATVTDIVLSFDQNLMTPAAVLLESIVANASGAIRLWVLGRGLTDAYHEWLAAAFPSVPMTFLPCDQVTYGVAGRPRRLTARITISTMDRLLLPDMLDDVSRVVYLDVDTLMLGDVCALARSDLGDRPLAARDSNVSEASEWRRAGRRLQEPLSTELRRWMGLRHGYGQAALNAGVLVLDLDRLRRDDFTATYLGWVEVYGFHDQDTMLAYVGPDRAVLDPRWNAIPTVEDVRDPRLIHWASFGKPWDPELTFEQERWREYATRLQDRAGTPPSDKVVGATGPAGTIGHPTQIGPVETALSPTIERVIEGVRREHLSYLGVASLRTLAASVEAIEAGGIDGLIIEAGTARGGSAITLAAAKSAARRMKVYDVFDMIPPPGERDGADVHERYATIVSGGSTGIGGETYYGYRQDLLAEVTESFSRHGLPVAESNVELIQGRFEDTIALDEPIALAHLDGDWYASTMTCLTRIAPLLAVGGRFVIDDYDAWSGCRAAVDEYFAGRPGFRFERRGRLHIVRV